MGAKKKPSYTGFLCATIVRFCEGFLYPPNIVIRLPTFRHQQLVDECDYISGPPDISVQSRLELGQITYFMGHRVIVDDMLAETKIELDSREVADDD